MCHISEILEKKYHKIDLLRYRPSNYLITSYETRYYHHDHSTDHHHTSSAVCEATEILSSRCATTRKNAFQYHKLQMHQQPRTHLLVRLNHLPTTDACLGVNPSHHSPANEAKARATNASCRSVL